MKPVWFGIAAALMPAALVAQSTVPVPIAAALADPARSDQQGDDERRQAAAVLTFSGVKPGDAVIDYIPGSGYWTRILAGIVGDKGHVYAEWPQAGAKMAARALPALEARGLANVTASVQAGNLPTVPRPVDMVWTVQNYHDIANAGGEPALRAFNATVFNLLKPGGTFLIVDHAAAPRSELSATATLHRIDPAAVKRMVQAQGFRFVGESKVLADAADDHTLKIFDPAIRGRTDQFVYRFRRP